MDTFDQLISYDHYSRISIPIPPSGHFPIYLIVCCVWFYFPNIIFHSCSSQYLPRSSHSSGLFSSYCCNPFCPFVKDSIVEEGVVIVWNLIAYFVKGLFRFFLEPFR